ncbi:MAG: metal-dependent hydrolase [Pseudomonadales bacterium]|nr:metal-dependent hydrolase [Pseudomonadales bacterium]
MNAPFNAVKTTPVDVKPRRMSFPFQNVKTKYFFDDNPILSAFWAALSSTFPPGEAEFIESVRLYRDQIEDEKLLEQVRGFIGQEGHHSHQHEKINRHLKALGFDAVRLEKHLEKDIEKFIADGYRSHPKVRLAMTAGMEHITAIMSEFILNNPEVLEPLQETMRELIYWHAVEEIEHKAVAFDVYQQCVGNEDLRRRTLRIATLMFSLRITAYTIALLWWSKSLPSFKDIRGAFSFMFGKKGMIRNIRKPYMAYFKEGFHPWDSDNRDLIEKWKNNFYDAKHDRGSDEFDTSALDKGMDNGIAAA